MARRVFWRKGGPHWHAYTGFTRGALCGKWPAALAGRSAPCLTKHMPGCKHCLAVLGVMNRAARAAG